MSSPPSLTVAESTPWLVRLIFHRWLRIGSIWLSLFGLFLLTKSPAAFYGRLLAMVSQFVRHHLGVQGQLASLEYAFHRLGWGLISLFFLGNGFLLAWQRIMSKAKNHEKDVPSRPLMWTKKEIAGVGILTGVAFLLRFPPSFQSLWADEISTYVHFIHPGFWANFMPSIPVGSHPLPQFVVMAFTGIGGAAEWSLRFPALIISTISVPLLYGVTRRMSGVRFCAGLAAFFLTIHSYHIYFSFQCKGYNVVVFFVILSIYLLHENLQRPRVFLSYLFGFVNVLLVYSHLYSALFVVAEHLAVLVLALRRGVSRQGLYAYWNSLMVTALGAGVLYAFQARNIVLLTFNPHAQTPGILAYAGQVLSDLHYVVSYSPWRIAIWIFLGCLAIRSWRVGEPERAKFLVIFCAAVILLVTFLFPTPTGFFSRYLIAEVPLIVWIVTFEISSLWQSHNRNLRLLGGGLAAAFLVLTFSGYGNTYQKIEDFRSAVDFVEREASPDTPRLAFSQGEFGFSYYDPKVVKVTDLGFLQEAVRTNPEVYVMNSVRLSYRAEDDIAHWVKDHCSLRQTFPGEFPIRIWRCTA